MNDPGLAVLTTGARAANRAGTRVSASSAAATSRKASAGDRSRWFFSSATVRSNTAPSSSKTARSSARFSSAIRFTALVDDARVIEHESDGLAVVIGLEHDGCAVRTAAYADLISAGRRWRCGPEQCGLGVPAADEFDRERPGRGSG